MSSSSSTTASYNSCEPPEIHTSDVHSAEVHSPELQRLIDFYEHLSPKRLVQLPHIYAQQAWFKDPFNEVQGLPAIEHIFAHMFVALRNPSFRIMHAVQQAQHAHLVWEFRFTVRGLPPQTCIQGATHIEFDKLGLVVRHRDYWDAAEELYARLPVLGAGFRWLARRFTTPQT